MGGHLDAERRRADQRRIIDAAYEVFYKDGLARAGVDAIAEAANVIKRTLYYHFNSKDELLAAVLDTRHQLAMQRIERWAMQPVAIPEL